MLRLKGFTFIELQIGLLICAVFMIVCMSNSFNSLQSNQIELLIAEIKNMVNYTRLQSNILNNNLKLKPLNNDWSYGAKLLKEENRQYQTLNIWNWKQYNVNISWHGFQSNDFLLFTPVLHSQALNGFFLIKYKHKEYKLFLNRLGRFREN